MTTRPSYVPIQEWQRRQRALLPKDYTASIRSEANKISAVRPELTGAQAAAVATHRVLDRRLRYLFQNEYNSEEVRLEPAAKVEWAGRQMERVEANPNYRSAERV